MRIREPSSSPPSKATMRRYRLPKLRVSRLYGQLKDDTQEYVDLVDLSDEKFSIHVQHAASRDEVETTAEPKKKDSFQQAEAAPPVNDSHPRAQPHAASTFKRIQKLTTTIAKTSSKLSRRNKNATLPKPITQTTIHKSDEPAASACAAAIMPPVLLSIRQDSVSTLSQSDFPKTTPIDLDNLDPENDCESEQEERDEPDPEVFDLSFEEMSFSTQQPPQQQPAVRANTFGTPSAIVPTDIWSACRMGDEGFVRGALAHNSGILMQTYQGRTSLYCAAHAGNGRIVQLLLEHGATDPDGTAFASALNDECRRLLDKPKREQQTVERKEPLPNHGTTKAVEETFLPTAAAVDEHLDRESEVVIEMSSPDKRESITRAKNEDGIQESRDLGAHASNLVDRSLLDNSYQSFGLENGTSYDASASRNSIGRDDEITKDGSRTMLSPSQSRVTSQCSQSEYDDSTVSSSDSMDNACNPHLARVLPDAWLQASRNGLQMVSEWSFDVCKL